jgi:hypothetical protein
MTKTDAKCDVRNWLQDKKYRPERGHNSLQVRDRPVLPTSPTNRPGITGTVHLPCPVQGW